MVWVERAARRQAQTLIGAAFIGAGGLLIVDGLVRVLEDALLSKDGQSTKRKVGLIGQLKASAWGKEAARYFKSIIVSLSLMVLGLIGLITSAITLGVGDESFTTTSMVGLFVTILIGLCSFIYLNIIRIRVSLAIIRRRLDSASDV